MIRMGWNSPFPTMFILKYVRLNQSRSPVSNCKANLSYFKNTLLFFAVVVVVGLPPEAESMDG